METSGGDEPLTRQRRAVRATPPLLSILQFAVTLLVMALLAAGPAVGEAFGRLRGHLQGSPALSVSSTPAPSAAAPAAHPTPAPGPAVRPPVAAVRTPTPPRAATPKTGAPAPPALRSAARAPRSEAYKQHERLLREGVDLYLAGWYGPALGRFKQAVAAMPTSARAHLWIGRAAMRVGRFNEARQALERAVALAPNTDAAYEARLLLAWFR